MAIAPQNGASPPQANSAASQQAQVRVVGQFIKDLSFENPSIGRVQIEPNEQPNIRIEVNVNAQNVGLNAYESVIELKANCSAKAGMLYDMEIQYGALRSRASSSTRRIQRLWRHTGHTL